MFIRAELNNLFSCVCLSQQKFWPNNKIVLSIYIRYTDVLYLGVFLGQKWWQDKVKAEEEKKKAEEAAKQQAEAVKGAPAARGGASGRGAAARGGARGAATTARGRESNQYCYIEFYTVEKNNVS